MLLLIFSLFSNFWIWKTFKLNFFTFILTTIFTILLWLIITKKLKFRYYALLLLLFLGLIFFQWKTTTWHSLTILSNDEQRVQSERLKFYNPSSNLMRILFYRLNLINFLEGDIGIAGYRLQRNFFETIDLNVYFFAGHPRERVWAFDFDKFPYVFIFPFLIGFYVMAKRKIYLILLSICMGLLTIIGHENNLGPFVLFPLITTAIALGLGKIIKWVRLSFYG